MKKSHLYHILEKNQWPFFTSIGAFNLIISLIYWINRNSICMLVINFIFILLCMYGWFRDISREADLGGEHTLVVKRGIIMGFLLFLFSEVMIFLTLFISFFYYSLSPSIFIGLTWPPVNILGVSPIGIPLLNTIILVTSGFTVTTSHILLKAKRIRESILYLIITILLGLLFFFFQISEYLNVKINITDSIYGSIFFAITGLHGFHVFVGIIFLLVCLIRIIFSYQSRIEHISYEFAIWYWHFVDIIWIFVMVFIYTWSYIY